MLRPGLRTIVASAALACAAAPAMATTIGPDAFGNIAEDTTISWVEISTTGTALTQSPDEDNGTAGPVSIGFTFNFYGVDYTQVFVSTNGLVTFGSANPSNVNVDLSTSVPGSADPVPAAVDVPTIAVFYDDMHFSTGPADDIFVLTQGNVGSREFIIQWNRVRHAFLTNTGRFQIILNEGSNRILLQYLDVDFGADAFDDAASATIGIRDTNGQNTGDFLQWSFNVDGAVTSNGAILIKNPEPGTMALFGAGALGIAAAVVRRRRARRR